MVTKIRNLQDKKEENKTTNIIVLHQLYIGIDKKKRENIASGRGVRGGGI